MVMGEGEMDSNVLDRPVKNEKRGFTEDEVRKILQENV